MGLLEAHNYCINNDIRVSPIAAESGMKCSTWHVGISDPKNYKKIYKSPEIYTEEDIWDKVSETEQYYYEKRNIQ